MGGDQAQRCSPCSSDIETMANVASALKEEISRISRKEILREIGSLKKSSATYRSEIAALKRRVVTLERQFRQTGKGAETAAPNAANDRQGKRFSAKSRAL